MWALGFYTKFEHDIVIATIENFITNAGSISFFADLVNGWKDFQDFYDYSVDNVPPEIVFFFIFIYFQIPKTVKKCI